MKVFWSSLLEVIEVLAVAIISVFLIKTFLVQPFLVSGDSMEPNFSDGNYLLVDELSYRFREPERGEVVVFRYPQNESVFYVKRLIGLPGESVEVKDGVIKIYNEENPRGRTLGEDYLLPVTRTSGDLRVTLEMDQFFVMGDNRLYSFDSRSWGPLPKRDILGLVRFNLWPLKSVRAITVPTY